MDLYLERITVGFPGTKSEFSDSLASLIGVIGRNDGHIIRLDRSDPSFYPEILLDLQSGRPEMVTDFALSNGKVFSVKIENSTGLSRKSPHSYEPINLETVRQRLAASGLRLLGIDHVGFNLPWFSSDLHPKMVQLREELSSRCLYHKYPTGEPWDFILPGEVDEIGNRKPVDYSEVRRPKFELVSFDKASTPLIQLDVGVNAGYATFSMLFPESLNDPEFRNTWVYLENPYAIDLCLVINEFTERDWSGFFEGSRL